MHTRLIPALLAGGLGATLALAQDPGGIPPRVGPGEPGGQPGKAEQPGRAERPDDKTPRPGGMMTSLDGNWTVVSAARDGKAVDGADKMTVTIKGNMVTFAGGAEKTPMRAMRLDFGPAGTVRVAEASPDGKFDTPGTPGARPDGGPGGTADRPPPSITPAPPGGTPQQPARPGGTGADAGTGMTGVYVLTPDFLAISVFEPGFASGTPPAGGARPGDPPAGGVRPGGTGTTPPPAAGTQPPGTGTTPPAGGTGTQPGGTGTGTGTGTQPGGTGTGTGTQPGGTGTRPGDTVGTIGGTGPEMRSHVSVVLKRAGGTGTPPGRP